MENTKTHKIEVTENFSANVEKLYEAWTNPEALKQWWKPMHNPLKNVTNDVTEGGEVVYTFNDKLTISGNYSEVKPNERLAYTWNWTFEEDALKDAHYKLTVDFKSEGEGSTIKVTQDHFENEEGSLAHKEGWEKGLQDLKEYLEGSNTGVKHNYSSANLDRSEGYNQAPEQDLVGGGEPTK